MLSSEDAWGAPFDRLNNDVLRKIYVEYVKIFNEKRLEDISNAISQGISALVAASLSTRNPQGFCHRGTRPYETITGVVRPYGMGKVITVNVGNVKCILRLKRVADVYAMTDWECSECSKGDFVYRVLSKTIQNFNTLPVQVDSRKPPRRWVRLETRDKFIEELIQYTSIPEHRVSRLVDG
jgi:ribosomal protein S17